MKVHLSGSLETKKLDKEFESMLFPLHLMQVVILQPKYKMLRGSIKRNDFLLNLLCFTGILLIMFIYVGKALTPTYNFPTYYLAKLFQQVNVIDAVFYITSFLIMYISNIIYGISHIEMILKMHRVYRVLDRRAILRPYRIYNWIFFGFIFIMYCFFIISDIVVQNVKVFYILSIYPSLCFDANLIFATQIIKFLTSELKLWRLEVEGFLVTCSETNHIQLRKYLKRVSQRGKLLYRAYLDILEAFKLCEKLFHKTVFLYAMDFFLHFFMNIHTFIEIIKLTGIQGFSITIVTVTVAMGVIKNIAVLSCLCAACQQFYLAIADVNMASAVIRSEEGCLVDARRLCKKVSRVSVSWGSAPRMRAGGVLVVDATLPLRLLHELATYTIVLLQFTFL